MHLNNKSISLSIILPAFNEEGNIKATLEDALKFVKKKHLSYEIIVVDDGSTDKTASKVEEAIDDNPNIRLIRHKKNQGYGSAVYDGLRAGRGEYIFFTDSDGQFRIYDLNRFLLEIKKYDAVIGYRCPRRDPVARKINTWGWKLLNRLTFGLKVRDIDCAYKLFRRSALQNLNVKSRGAMFSAELIMRLAVNKNKIHQLPVKHYPRRSGVQTGANPKVILRAFRELKSVRHELKQKLSQNVGWERMIF